jgi:hypothetical protein
MSSCSFDTVNRKKAPKLKSASPHEKGRNDQKKKTDGEPESDLTDASDPGRLSNPYFNGGCEFDHLGEQQRRDPGTDFKATESGKRPAGTRLHGTSPVNTTQRQTRHERGKDQTHGQCRIADNEHKHPAPNHLIYQTARTGNKKKKIRENRLETPTAGNHRSPLPPRKMSVSAVKKLKALDQFID